MSIPRNTTLDDISAVIGFTATVQLAAYHGGKNVHVPGADVSEQHPIAKAIGVSAARRLAAEFGWDKTFAHLYVPSLACVDVAKRNAAILHALADGERAASVAGRTGLSTRRVNQLRREFESDGLLEPG